MATKKTTKSRPSRSGPSASDASLRDHVREISVAAFRDRKFSLRDVNSLVHEVLEGAAETVDESIPKSSRNILREVFDGLSEGVHAVASAASNTASEAAGRARKAATKDAPSAAHRIREANEEFLDAVTSFASKTTKQVRDELNTMVARAEKAGPKMTDAARNAYKAADGRWSELSAETARAGAKVAGRTVGAMAATAGGFFDGIAEATKPTSRPAAKPARKAKKKSAAKPAAKKAPAKRRKR